jgi:hypothetical protein
MGGAYSNFKPWLRTDKLILKLKKKYRQNRREKLRRTMYFSADSEFHATTLLKNNTQIIFCVNNNEKLLDLLV